MVASLQGWGCGYRTLQSLCSWTRANLDSTVSVPSIPQIQDALVAMGDKEEKFRGSRDWIGSVEVGLCHDYFYNVRFVLSHLLNNLLGMDALFLSDMV